jgi:hypothetical protein
MQTLLTDVASVGEEYEATPEDMQLALEFHEPALAIGEKE